MYKKFMQLKLTHILHHVESERNSLYHRTYSLVCSSSK